jgi:hypothetical protein
MLRFVEHRQRYFVDSQVQRAILREALRYWLFGLLAYCVVLFVCRFGPDLVVGHSVTLEQFWFHLGPVIITSVILLPVMMFSVIRFSHRFVGPMVRFRQVLGQLVRGENPPWIVLRQNDFWQDFAREMNDLAERWSELAVQEKREDAEIGSSS